MPIIRFSTNVKQGFQRVVNGFDRELFTALKPPLLQLKVMRFDGCKKGDRVELFMKIGPVKQLWHSLITEDQATNEYWYFIDKGVLLPYPLTYWKHKHAVIAIDGRSKIIDEIKFKTGFILTDIIMYPIIFSMFWLRKPIYRRYFSHV
jgi:ligand-binding SRPBCC domain-containing protein